MKPQRARVWVFRTAIVIFAVLIVLYILSGWSAAGWMQVIGSRGYLFACGEGLVGLGIADPDLIVDSGVFLESQAVGWRWWFLIAQTPRSSQLFVPIWLPMLVVALVVWYSRPRRHRSACCESCGYSLEGSTIATCPECGREHA